LRPERAVLTVLLACAALPLAACEHGIGLQGKVSVPGRVQHMFSAEHPGELVVKAQIPGQPDITAPSVILCGETGTGERVIDVKYVKMACARDDVALVSAWVVPRTAHEVSCTAPPPQPRPPDTEQSANAVAFARTLVSVAVATATPTSCKDGTISFALTLEPR